MAFTPSCPSGSGTITAEITAGPGAGQTALRLEILSFGEAAGAVDPSQSTRIQVSGLVAGSYTARLHNLSLGTIIATQDVRIVC